MEDDLAGDVDFDFFDDNGKRSPDKKSLSKSPLHSAVNGKPPIPSPARTPTKFNVKNGDNTKTSKTENYSSDESDKSYSSDYDSDEDKPTPKKSKEVKIINARLPSADSGGRRSSPHIKQRKKSHPDSSESSDSESDSPKKHSDSEDSYTGGSSSAYSDDSGVDKKKKKKDKRVKISESKKKAWDIGSENIVDNKELESQNHPRPKTGMRRSRNSKSERRRHGSGSSSSSGSDSYTSDSDSDSSLSTNRKSNSESEITDVSPLQSAESSPVLKRKSNKHMAVISAPKKDNKQYTELPNTNYDNVHRPTEGTMEFKLLMQAVAELDSEKQKRIKASTRRVMFAPANPSNQQDKSNYSFSSMQTRIIDSENERLLQQIIKKRLPVKKKENHSQVSSYRRLPNSAVNRLKEQRRIEQENLAFVQRLQGIRPTRGMTKREQLKEYHRQIQYGVPSLNQPCLTNTANGSIIRTRSISSMSSVHSGFTSPSSTTASRSRPSSAKKFPVDTRPAWDGRW